MKQTLTVDIFIRDMLTYNTDVFSYDALVALFEYFEELEEDCDMEIEFDPQAIVMQWTQYISFEELSNNYDFDGDNEFEGEPEAFIEAFLDNLSDNTQWIALANDQYLVMDW